MVLTPAQLHLIPHCGFAVQIVRTSVSQRQRNEPSLQTNKDKAFPIDLTDYVPSGIWYKKHRFRNGTFSHPADLDNSIFEEEKK